MPTPNAPVVRQIIGHQLSNSQCTYSIGLCLVITLTRHLVSGAVTPRLGSGREYFDSRVPHPPNNDKSRETVSKTKSGKKSKTIYEPFYGSCCIQRTWYHKKLYSKRCFRKVNFIQALIDLKSKYSYETRDDNTYYVYV